MSVVSRIFTAYLHFFTRVMDYPVYWLEHANLSNGQTIIVGLGWLYLVVIANLFAAVLLLLFIRKLPRFISFILRKFGRSSQERPANVFLELVFPSDTAKSAYATEQLHGLLRNQVRYRSALENFSGVKLVYSPEIVATHDGGIRFVLMVPLSQAEEISRNLTSYLPGMKVRRVGDYTPSIKGRRVGITELKLGGSFCLPLKDNKTLEEHDPMAFITKHMAGLSQHDLIAIQMVTTPVLRSTHFRVTQKARSLKNTIARDNILGPELHRKIPRIVWICLLLPVYVGIYLLKFVLSMLMVFNHNDGKGTIFKSGSDKRPAHNPYEQELATAVKDKLGQDLFEVTVRILVASDSEDTISSRLGALVNTYRMFNSSYQSIIPKRKFPLFIPKQNDILLKRFVGRKLTPTVLDYGFVVSGSEFADLYHFPNTGTAKTEGLLKSRSRELAVPLSITHSGTKLDVIVGMNSFGGQDSPIGMTLPQRQKHTYIIGKTGTGKTTLLVSSIYQDMVNGKGLAMLDAHGDMFNEILRVVPENRRNDVIVFNPADRDFPVGLNILDPGIPFTSVDAKNEWITSTVLSIFEKLADKHQWGPRMEHILTNATMTALQLPNPNLYTLQRLLTEKAYQRTVAKDLKDPVLKQFWAKEFKLMGTMQLSTQTAPLTNRLGHFITTKLSRHILLQEKSTLHIADIMDSGKILLANLSKGSIGADQSEFFGTILTSFIWLAAEQRTNIPEPQRKDFFLYVDEFQNFATPHFSEIASEGRKFRVPLIVSHQNTAQIEDKSLLQIVAGNADTIICLKASPEDEAFILPYMEPEVKKGDIVNLAPYHFFMKTTTDDSEDAFSGTTVPLDVTGSEETREAVVGYSRERYGRPVKEVEVYMEELFGQEDTKKRQKKDGGEDSDTGSEDEDAGSKDSGGLFEG